MRAINTVPCAINFCLRAVEPLEWFVHILGKSQGRNMQLCRRQSPYLLCPAGWGSADVRAALQLTAAH